jgi:hypothetical protein
MSNFRFVKDATTWWPVRWLEPIDGGSAIEVGIELRFVRKPWDELTAVYQMTNFDFITHVARDWRGITDDADRPVPFAAEPLAELCQRPNFGEAIGAAYVAFLRALPETRLGNFEASPAGGPEAAAKTADPVTITMP